MADFATENVFLTIVYFVIPSAIALWIYDHIIPGEKRDWGSSIVVYACYGVLLYAISWALLQLFRPVWPPSMIALPQFQASIDYRFLVLGCLVVPVCAGLIAALVPKLGARSLKKLSHGLILHPEPTDWDFVFAQRKEPFFLLFHLKDGTMIGGYYEADSYVTTYPQPQQIYVQAAYKPLLEGWEEVPGTKGCLISRDECTYIELFEVKSGADTVVNAQTRRDIWLKRMQAIKRRWLRLFRSTVSSETTIQIRHGKGVVDQCNASLNPSHPERSEVPSLIQVSKEEETQTQGKVETQRPPETSPKETDQTQ